jgi:hypothetical protein
MDVFWWINNNDARRVEDSDGQPVADFYSIEDAEAAIKEHNSQFLSKGREFLSAKFLEAMNDIGRYGNDKYGQESFHQRQKSGDKSRGSLSRASSEAIAQHAQEHFSMHLRGERHDYFGTRKHQLAAVAFNAMMEFYFAGLEDEVLDTKLVFEQPSAHS